MSNKSRLLFFTAGNRRYAISFDRVKRVVPLDVNSKAPLLKEFFDGVFRFEGEMVALLNLAALHGRGGGGESADPLVLIYKIDKQLVGLIIDQVDNVGELCLSNLIAFDSGLTGVEKKVVFGNVDFLFLELNSLDFN